MEQSVNFFEFDIFRAFCATLWLLYSFANVKYVRYAEHKKLKKTVGLPIVMVSIEIQYYSDGYIDILSYFDMLKTYNNHNKLCYC